MAISIKRLTADQKQKLADILNQGAVDPDDVNEFLSALEDETIEDLLTPTQITDIVGTSEAGAVGRIIAKPLKSFKLKPVAPLVPQQAKTAPAPEAPKAVEKAGKGKGKAPKAEKITDPELIEKLTPEEPFVGAKGKVQLQIKKQAPKPINTGDVGPQLVEQLIDEDDYYPAPTRKDKDPDSPTFGQIIPKDTDLLGFIDRPEIMRAFETFFETKHNLMLIGEAGSGKSTIGKYWVYEKNKQSPVQKLPYLAISADGLLSVNALFGSPRIINGTSYFVEGLFTTFTKIPSLILIDEVTALDPSKNFVFHQILAERKFFVKEANKTYYMHPQCMIIFAGNPMNPRYPGVGKMNLAFADRMGTFVLEPLNIKEIRGLFEADVKRGDITKQELDKLMSYTESIRDYIHKTPSVKAEFSTRSLKRIVSFLSQKIDFRTAVEWAFINTYTAFDRATYDSLMTVTNNFFTKA